MDRCGACGHAYFAAWSTGHPSRLCAACRLRKAGGLRLRRAGPLGDGARRSGTRDDDWLPLRVAASALGLKVGTLHNRRWLARLGAIKVGKQWVVARAALGGLIEHEGRAAKGT